MSLSDQYPSQTKPSLGKFEFIALMAALMAINALAIDIMLPALPAMGDALMSPLPTNGSL